MLISVTEIRIADYFPFLFLTVKLKDIGAGDVLMPLATAMRTSLELAPLLHSRAQAADPDVCMPFDDSHRQCYGVYATLDSCNIYAMIQDGDRYVSNAGMGGSSGGMRVLQLTRVALLTGSGVQPAHSSRHSQF